MKIGILQTAPTNCAKLAELLSRYPDATLINYVDECIWEHVLAAGGEVTDKCHRLMIEDFKKMMDAGCDRLALLCSLIKPGIEGVRKEVELPIIVYDDVQAERAVAVTPDGGKIAVIAMKETPLEPGKKAVLEAAQRAGKTVSVEKICVEAAQKCFQETGSNEMADIYFERYLREHQGEYSTYVIPQVPLTRIMPKLRDMSTPVFDSLEPFIDKLIFGYESGFEAELIKK